MSQLIWPAMATVREHLAKQGLGKNQTNSHQGFKFRGIDDLYGVLQPALAVGNVVMLPSVAEIERKEALTSKGTVQYFTIAKVNYQFTHTGDGSSVVLQYAGEAADTGDKSLSKALTMSMKYLAFHAFQIPLNGNDDGDAHTAEETAAPTLPEDIKHELEQAAEIGLHAFRDYWKSLDKDTRKLAQQDKKWFDGLRETAENAEKKE